MPPSTARRRMRKAARGISSRPDRSCAVTRSRSAAGVPIRSRSIDEHVGHQLVVGAHEVTLHEPALVERLLDARPRLRRSGHVAGHGLGHGDRRGVEHEEVVDTARHQPPEDPPVVTGVRPGAEIEDLEPGAGGRVVDAQASAGQARPDLVAAQGCSHPGPRQLRVLGEATGRDLVDEALQPAQLVDEDLVEQPRLRRHPGDHPDRVAPVGVAVGELVVVEGLDGVLQCEPLGLSRVRLRVLAAHGLVGDPARPHPVRERGRRARRAG